MIELDFQLPLPSYTLQVEAELPGDVTAIMGPSGAGKTSALEVIAGLRPRARGRVRVLGELFLDSARGIALPPEQRRIGYVPQHPALFPHLDVASNIRYAQRGDEEPRRFEQTVELLDLRDLLRRRTPELSGGEAQRVALGRALLRAPRVLLLDEPLAALDVALQQRIVPYLVRIRDEARLPMLYVTHRAGEALVLATHALMLTRGRVEAQGPVRDVLDGRRMAALREDATFDNLVLGTVLEPGAIALDGGPHRLVVPAHPDQLPGGRAHYRVASEDILLLRERPRGISARNVFAVRVLAVEWCDTEALVALSGLSHEWRARVTRAAAIELEIAPRSELWAAIKTHAFARL